MLIWLCKDRAKSRRDLEECLGANGQVCILRARQYGWYGPRQPEDTQLGHLRCFEVVQSPGQDVQA